MPLPPCPREIAAAGSTLAAINTINGRLLAGEKFPEEWRTDIKVLLFSIIELTSAVLDAAEGTSKPVNVQS